MFTRLQREASTAEMAAKLIDLTYNFDVTELLPRLRVPTLVIHRKGDKAIPFHLGREMASMIPNSHFVPLEEVFITFLCDADAVLPSRVSFEYTCSWNGCHSVKNISSMTIFSVLETQRTKRSG